MKKVKASFKMLAAKSKVSRTEYIFIKKKYWMAVGDTFVSKSCLNLHALS